MESKGIHVEGIIYDMEKSIGTENVSYPIVRFLTLDNIWITQTSKVSSILGFPKKGDKVTVIYQKGDPHNFIVKHRLSFLVPVILFSIAIILMILAIARLLHI